MSTGEVTFYRKSNVFSDSEGSQFALKPGNKRKQLCSGITFAAVEIQPHLQDMAYLPAKLCSKGGYKGTESPAGMWKGLDRTSLIITWPGYQCWCRAAHMSQKIIDSTLKTLLVERRYLQWHKCTNGGLDPQGLKRNGFLVLICVGLWSVHLFYN